MRTKIAGDLVLLNLLVLALVFAILFFPSNVARIILGLPFVLFFPGFVLVAALYPTKDQVDGVQRLALSLGLSIVVVSLIGLALNYTPWGITLESVLYSIAAFVLAMSVVAWIRRRALPSPQRSGGGFRLKIPAWQGSRWDKGLSVLLAVSVVGALVMAGYVIVKPKVGERFTEFYLLSMEGKAVHYPTEAVMGRELEVIVGIINQEHETADYQLAVTLDGVRNRDIGPITLGHGEKWQQPVSFTPDKPGEGQKVEFLLYRAGDTEPYLEPLRLWISTRED